eukprot:12590-Heterococcus_DN1.PRE.3
MRSKEPIVLLLALALPLPARSLIRPLPLSLPACQHHRVACSALRMAWDDYEVADDNGRGTGRFAGDAQDGGDRRRGGRGGERSSSSVWEDSGDNRRQNRGPSSSGGRSQGGRGRGNSDRSSYNSDRQQRSYSNSDRPSFNDRSYDDRPRRDYSDSDDRRDGGSSSGGRGRGRGSSAFGRGGRGLRSSDRAYPKADEGWRGNKIPEGEHTAARGSKAWLRDDLVTGAPGTSSTGSITDALTSSTTSNRPAWKLAKTEYGKSIIQQKADGHRSKDGYTATSQSSLIAAAVEKPSWLPAKGGLKIKSQQRIISKRPLPPGVDTSAATLSLEALEARLKQKFSSGAMKPIADDDDELDFYDKDDEGYEGDVVNTDDDADDVIDNTSATGGNDSTSDVVDSIPAMSITSESAAAVISAETAAKQGGFRMRQPIEAEEVYSDGLTAAQQLAQQAEQQTDTALPTTQKAKKLKPSDDQFKIEYLQHLTLASIGTLEQRASVSFEECGVSNVYILDNLAGMGIEQPTHVQAAALTELLDKSNDVIIHAHTGSGKTLAFLLPLLQSIDETDDSIQAVVIAPGRELGSQIYAVAEALTQGTGIRSQMLIGGANVNRQYSQQYTVHTAAAYHTLYTTPMQCNINTEHLLSVVRTPQ